MKKQKIFQYGNYDRYYGYRNANNEKDKRINAFEQSWFEGKSCLDIGCNVGHLTLWLSKHFKVKTMKGVDIDCYLIKAAKNNILHYLDNEKDTEKEQTIVHIEEKERKGQVKEHEKGNEQRTLTENNGAIKDKTRFPYNINFVTVSILCSNLCIMSKSNSVMQI